MAPWRSISPNSDKRCCPFGRGRSSSLALIPALVGSMAVGFLYWTLRDTFRTSRAAALVGSSLLLSSVIRLEETNIIDPHHLMLACTLMLAGLGYQWARH